MIAIPEQREQVWDWAHSAFPSEELAHMKGEQKERWMYLCALAAQEQDPDKLLLLIREINALLEAKEKRLNQLRTMSSLSTEAPKSPDAGSEKLKPGGSTRSQ